jgi:hypothetical protein
VAQFDHARPRTHVRDRLTVLGEHACAAGTVPCVVRVHRWPRSGESRRVARPVTVMAISGHSSTRMLARYTHPTAERKYGALETFGADFVGQEMGSTAESASASDPKLKKLLEILVDGGGIEPPTSALRTQFSRISR